VFSKSFELVFFSLAPGFSPVMRDAQIISAASAASQQAEKAVETAAALRPQPTPG
jgi:hypothetical protein